MVKELGYCGCASHEGAVRVLRDTPEFAGERRKLRQWRRWHEGANLERGGAKRRVDASLSRVTWSLDHLDHRGFVQHAGNVTGCWVTGTGLPQRNGIRS
jgi:hypothetical protein